MVGHIDCTSSVAYKSECLKVDAVCLLLDWKGNVCGEEG